MGPFGAHTADPKDQTLDRLADLWVLKGNTTSVVADTVQTVYTALNDSQLLTFNSNSVKKMRQ